jgi:hypothetical protein
MNAGDQLEKAYQEWRSLAKAEGDAIRAGNWTVVSDCQQALKMLQPQILNWTGPARKERAELGSLGVAREKNLQKLISETVELEQRNQAALDELSREARTQFGQLQQAGHTLRQVQRSYAPARPPAWSSFS